MRILSHNVWCHYPMTYVPWKQCGHAIWGFRCKTRLELLARHINSVQYDVVCLQELFVLRLSSLYELRSNFDYMVDLLAQGGYVHHSDPCDSLRADRTIGQNSGVAIFSRHPLESVESVDFECTAERSNTKGFVVADVRRDGRLVRVVSAHLDARDWTAKSSQITQLADYLVRKASVVKAETVVCGDLNVCPQTRGSGGYDDGTQYAHLAAEFGRAGLTDAWAPEESQPTEGNATLDHIFYRADAWREEAKSVVRVQDEEGLSVSDHYGLDLLISPH